MAEKKPVIIIVDSSKAMRAMVQDALKDLNAEIMMFDNGPPVIKHLEDNVPSLILISTKLVGKGGLSLLQQIRRLKNHKDTPVIIASSKNYEQDITIAGQLGARFLIMPFSMKEIRDTVNECLNLTS